MPQNWKVTQLSNRNFLSPVGFKFAISKVPKADFLSNSAMIPGINLGFALQPTYLKDIPVPGDKMSYEDFTLRFLIDENLENYLEVHKWMRVVVIASSVLFFRNPVSPMNLAGTCIALAGVFAYSQVAKKGGAKSDGGKKSGGGAYTDKFRQITGLVNLKDD